MSYIAQATNHFDEVVRFYSQGLGLPIVASWDCATARGLRFDLGGIQLEILDNSRKLRPLCLGESADRFQVVGLQALDESKALPMGAQLLRDGTRTLPAATEGHVTSSYWSPTLGKPVALAVLAGGQRRAGETVTVYSNGNWLSARVVAPKFYDPEGVRLNA